MANSYSSDQTIDFLVVTALAEEQAAVLRKLPDHKRQRPNKDDIRNYYRADLQVTFPDKTTGIYRLVVMCFLGMGRVQATAATSDAIRHWHPRYVLLVGIAGGIAAKRVMIGDVLVSDQFADYELQKILADKEPEIRWDVQRADPRMLDACKNFRGEKWEKSIQIERPDSGKPACQIGTIVSGDKVIAFNKILADFSKTWPKLIGVEMEASGAATAAFQSANKPGFFMVRGVSDLADQNKDSPDVEKWRQYACDVAASYAISLLRSGPVPLSEDFTQENTSNVQLILDGEFRDFTPTRRKDTVKVLAALLGIKPDKVRISKVISGSIVISLEIPEAGADRLYELAIKQDPWFSKIRAKSILISGHEMILFTNWTADNRQVMPERQSGKEIFRIFIASPGDVLLERETAYRVISNLNQIWEYFNVPIILDARLWERNTYADAGNPQAVIKRQIRIETFDILIGILWKRFGTPTGEINPKDGKPYLSGTEEEITEAFSLRKSTGRPLIMLYRKNSAVPSIMPKEDVIQYELVNRFFRQCQPGAQHPALIKEFRQEEFESILTRELSLAVSELKDIRQNSADSLEKKSAGEFHVAPKKVTTQRYRTNSERTKTRISKGKPVQSHLPRKTKPKGPLNHRGVNAPEEQEVIQWLENVGLKENPFRYQAAEYDEKLPNYFARFQELQSITTSDLIQDRKNWIFWGPEGSGKTALRKWLATREQQSAEALFLEYDVDILEQLLSNLTNPHLFQERFIRYVYEKVRSIDERGKNIHWQPVDTLQGCLANLTIALRDAGIGRLLCLIDPSKEFFSWGDQSISTASLFKPILTLSPGTIIGFRFFLPKGTKDELKQTITAQLWRQIRLTPIKWTQGDIKSLIRQRMTFFSRDQLAPYHSLGELCDDKNNLSSIIDAEIAGLAEGNPRGALWLANKVIESHCAKNSDTLRISTDSWDKTRMDWWTTRRSAILGIPEKDAFWLSNEHVFYGNKEIVLQERSHRLLHALVKAGEGFCSKDELINAGWLNDDPSGISIKALSEAVRRMKEALKRELKHQGWEDVVWTVKSVKGRGYRFQRLNPNAFQQEDNEDDTSK